MRFSSSSTETASMRSNASAFGLGRVTGISVGSVPPPCKGCGDLSCGTSQFYEIDIQVLLFIQLIEPLVRFTRMFEANQFQMLMFWLR